MGNDPCRYAINRLTSSVGDKIHRLPSEVTFTLHAWRRMWRLYSITEKLDSLSSSPVSECITPIILSNNGSRKAWLRLKFYYHQNWQFCTDSCRNMALVTWQLMQTQRREN